MRAFVLSRSAARSNAAVVRFQGYNSRRKEKRYPCLFASTARINVVTKRRRNRRISASERVEYPPLDARVRIYVRARIYQYQYRDDPAYNAIRARSSRPPIRQRGSNIRESYAGGSEARGRYKARCEKRVRPLYDTSARRCASGAREPRDRPNVKVAGGERGRREREKERRTFPFPRSAAANFPG